MWTNSTPSASSTFYPTFDPHGNQVSYISKVSGSSYWQAPQRSFDPWGNLRLGSAGNQPNGRYCANIGHESDDENAMVYMRARYYDQSCGRFISEDRAHDGTNWLTYAFCDPVNFIDRDGKSADSDHDMLIGAILKLVGFFFLTGGICWEYACFPAAIMQMLELAGEYNTIMELTRVLDQGVESSKWDQLKQQLEFLKNGFLYKKDFNAPRGATAGAIIVRANDSGRDVSNLG